MNHLISPARENVLGSAVEVETAPGRVILFRSLETLKLPSFSDVPVCLRRL